ncbi:MAG TPA: hypothetical protein VJT09_03450 [Pyrinomonadaceae bacterium]|nr:hypothetical protein [Pyrinomonadaceae bacterium]
MTGSRPSNLEEYKIKASILLKLLKSNDPEKALGAATRFRRLPHLAALSPRDIVERKESVQRKHALGVIALEHNRASWAELKDYMEKREALKNRRGYTALYPRRCAGFLNEWYASYEVARGHLEQTGGYLLSYGSQFFICTAGYIKALGLDPEDPDWKLIRWDWVKPADTEAWERLNRKLQSVEAETAV